MSSPILWHRCDQRRDASADPSRAKPKGSDVPIRDRALHAHLPRAELGTHVLCLTMGSRRTEWSCGPPLPPEAGIGRLGRGQLVQADAAVALERERRLRREPDGRERERQRVNRDLPADERAGIVEQCLLFVRANVEHDRAAMHADEVVVPDCEPSPPIGDVVVQPVVRVPRRRPPRGERVDEEAARVHRSSKARTSSNVEVK